MRRVHPFLLLLSIFLFPTSLFSQTKQEADPNADLAAYFSAETKRMADDCLEGIESLEDWTKKKAELRQQLFEMLGLDPLPKKTDLKLKVTGETEEKEFVVKNVHFQSRPGLYVTGNLYLPKSKSAKKRPAVLQLYTGQTMYS